MRSTNSGDDKLSCQKAKCANFLEENFRKLRDLSLKTRNGWLPKKLVPKSKILELNSTELKQKKQKDTLRLRQKA